MDTYITTITSNVEGIYGDKFADLPQVLLYVRMSTRMNTQFTDSSDYYSCIKQL